MQPRPLTPFAVLRCLGQGSNLRPSAYKAAALPAELPRHVAALYHKLEAEDAATQRCAYLEAQRIATSAPQLSRQKETVLLCTSVSPSNTSTS
ncbi:hypothetical protein UFOVP435_44 [uncultured Caudovirales phage]|uniref:Uncharacterized protein n=1 Tax=uncultured Caudovirales phage TaxID=2100421 RepID=A0A6J5MD87_9CAUD|nr:hypothetical protein UFOVP435_44 [uncultured Caudovirales phage]